MTATTEIDRMAAELLADLLDEPPPGFGAVEAAAAVVTGGGNVDGRHTLYYLVRSTRFTQAELDRVLRIYSLEIGRAHV